MFDGDRETGRPRVIVADDHANVRRTMCRILSTDCEVAGEASDGETVVEMLPNLRPDAVIMDIEMPIMDGLAACSIIHRDFPEIPVVIVTSHVNEELEATAREAGAVSFVYKHRLMADLRPAVLAALNPARASDAIH